MQYILALSFTILLASVHLSTAGFASPAQHDECVTQMTAAKNAETDKVLLDALDNAHVTIRSGKQLIAALSDEQKAKLNGTYFSGACSPLTAFYYF